jgi:hypothetical protein
VAGESAAARAMSLIDTRTLPSMLMFSPTTPSPSMVTMSAIAPRTIRRPSRMAM